MTRRLLLPGLLLLGIAAFVVWTLLPAGRSYLGRAAPELDAVEWIGDDGRRRLVDHRGSAVLLVFWQTTCGPCRADMPLLQQLSERHAEDGLTVVGLTNESRERVLRFLALEEATPRYPIALQGGAAYEVRRVPHSYLVGPDGRVVWEGRSRNLPDEVLHGVLERCGTLPDELVEPCSRARLAAAREELAHGRHLSARACLEALVRDLPDTAAASVANVLLGPLRSGPEADAWRRLEELLGPGGRPIERLDEPAAEALVAQLTAFADDVEDSAPAAAVHARRWADRLSSS